MKNKNLTVVLSVVFLATAVFLGGLSRPANGFDQTSGPGTIPIDAMQSFSPLERPAVSFPHDLHTAAPSFQACTDCHALEGRKMFLFVETPEGASKRGTMDAWHKACMDCHKTLIKGGEKTGPMTCGECHQR